MLALYVASVVPNPARFAAEMRRVCRPGGTIVIVNHFMSDNWRHALSSRSAWRRSPARSASTPTSRSSTFIAAGQLAVREIRPSNLFGYWKLLRCVNDKPA